MEDGGALKLELAGVERIREILLAQFRLRSAWDPEVDPDFELTGDTSVAAWRAAGDLLGTRELGAALDRFFGTHHTLEAWRGVLEPPGERRLDDVCHLLAGQALLPRLRPARLAGESPEVAGAFLALRTLLVRRGHAAQGIRPRDPLGPWLRVAMVDLAEILLLLVPERAPEAWQRLRLDGPWLRARLGAAGLGAAGWGAALVGGVDPGLGLAGLGLAAVATAFLVVTAGLGLGDPPERVEIEGLENFRDLAEWMVREPRRDRPSGPGRSTPEPGSFL